MKPAKSVEMHYLLLELLEESGSQTAINFYTSSIKNGWQYYVVDQRRGECQGLSKIITIPSWLWKPSAMEFHLGATLCLQTKKNYGVWYLCHEMAHAMDYIRNRKMAHDESFMNCLKALCPPEAIGYEAGYQTKTALNCGIVPDDF